jgi:acetylornithine deacetylase/succinyl-diaminopimelate desuccinylase-like protein
MADVTTVESAEGKAMTVMEALAKYPEVVAAAQGCQSRGPELLELCIAVQQVAAPTLHEERRAAWIEGRLADLGLAEVRQDEAHNVYACVPGRTRTRSLLVSAHSDTVFGPDTDLTIKRDEETGRVYGPGLGDNSTGVAAIILLAEVLAGLPTPPVDIWLLANTGEEGIGDLRGMRAAVDALQPHVAASIVIEGMGLGRIVHRALGSRRYRISVSAPGGHSWSDFGTASAIHTLVMLAAELTQLRTSETPRSTFNIGRLAGGTSVNTIAQDAWLELDLRAETQPVLHDLVGQAQAIIAHYQGARWEQRGVKVTAEVIGDRPSGGIAPDHPLVQAAVSALAAVAYAGTPDLRISSTDANVPLSRGIPAVCVGVTDGGNAHRLQEWIQPGSLGQGMAHVVLLTWWAADWLARRAAE